MNLTNLFNLKFLKENLKRSRAVILLLIFLVPVINVIIYLMNATNNGSFMPSIFEIAPLSVVGMYIVPVLLSITLFSFIYKRKSSDFVMSFPVSKKQIFMSNTLGGIIIIIISNLVNYILLLIATLLLTNVLVDYRMLFDIFILWTISYIFVFTCTNIAVSVSSNRITTIVVTLLILFLVPFVHTFITSDSFKGTGHDNISTYCNNEICRPKNYECYDISCEINRKKDLYVYTSYNEIEENTNYTIPYVLIVEGLFGRYNYSINKSILKMALLSLIYIIVGLLLFQRKKFEVVETSFKSERTHILVRSLTTIPILCIYYIILKRSSIGTSDIFTIIFLFVIIFTYLIIYDLLTRKKVTNIFKSLAALIVVGTIVIFTGEVSSRGVDQIDVNSIDKITFTDTDLPSSGGYTDNKELINYIISIHIDNIKNEAYYRTLDVRITVSKKTYEFVVSVTEKEYNYIMEVLSKDETYQKTSKKIKNNDVFAIRLKGDGSYISKKDKLYSEIIEAFKNSDNKKSVSNALFQVELYTYSDFTTNTIYFNLPEDTRLYESILNYYNQMTKETLDNPDIEIYSYNYGHIDEITNTIDEEYISSYRIGETTLGKFILGHLDETVDINKPYNYIKFYTFTNGRTANLFITNRVDELEKIINDIKATEELDEGDIDDKYTD